MPENDVALMGHLMRRAGFSAQYHELEARAAKGYEETVEELLNPDETTHGMDLDLAERYFIEWNHHIRCVPEYIAFRMINSKSQLEEKMILFWHGILCHTDSKNQSQVASHAEWEMLRRCGMGSFKDLLIEISKDPAMVYFLDNCLSHKDAINENYGRELLELFSLGVGMDGEENYTENDVKNAARAFTGWTIDDDNVASIPFGKTPWLFRYLPEDHDDGEKTFMGHTGNFNGEDIIDIIVKQPATARFISRHLYNFFVADDVQVPAWQHTPPGDPEAIKVLEEEYFRSNYNIRSMLRVLFNSDTFKSDQARFAKVKSPAEVVVGTLHLLGDFKFPKRGIFEVALGCRYMGQDLLNPPSVEGWHTGEEWIDSGSLVERVNFVADRVSDIAQPGVRAMVDTLLDRTVELDPVSVINGCLELLGHVRLHEKNKEHLAGEIRSMLDQRSGLVAGSTEERLSAENTVLHTMKMIGSSREYQFA